MERREGRSRKPKGEAAPVAGKGNGRGKGSKPKAAGKPPSGPVKARGKGKATKPPALTFEAVLEALKAAGMKPRKGKPTKAGNVPVIELPEGRRVHVGPGYGFTSRPGPGDKRTWGPFRFTAAELIEDLK